MSSSKPDQSGVPDSERAQALVRIRANGLGPWLFLTVALLLVFKACGVSLW